MVTEVRASHILVATEKEANELKSGVERGESFAALAKQYSKCPSGQEGGDLGWFGRGVMVKSFEDAVFSAGKDLVAGPIKTQFGYHLVLVTDTRG